METKCAAFWRHVNIRNDNRVYPCCRFKNPVTKFDGNLSSPLHSQEFQTLRELSSAGVAISGCDKCYYEEKHGRTSLRQRINADYNTNEVGLQYLEIGFDNICNLTCDGCRDEFSSSWSKINNPDLDKSLHIRSTTDITHIPETINRISFHGGEPLMTNRHVRLLRMIPNLSQVTVIYNTNGTFLLDSDAVELLRQCQTVRFLLSIDGYGSLNEQVRSGSAWSDILKFIEQIQSLGFELRIHTTIHANNWHGLAELETWINQNQFTWTTNVLTFPVELDIRNTKDKSKIIDLISNTDIPNKTFVLNHLQNAS